MDWKCFELPLCMLVYATDEYRSPTWQVLLLSDALQGMTNELKSCEKRSKGMYLFHNSDRVMYVRSPSLSMLLVPRHYSASLPR